MATAYIVPLLLTFILSVISFYTKKIMRHSKKYREELLSLSAGLLTAILLFEFLPILSEGASQYGRNLIYLPFLIGFVLFYLSEKHVYREHDAKKMKQELRLLRLTGFFINHFIVGVALALVFMLKNILPTFLIFIPFLIHTLSSTHPELRFLRKYTLSKFAEFFLSMAPFFGALIVSGIHTQVSSVYVLFSLISGSLLYLVIHDILPRHRRGEPAWFLIGTAIATTVLIFVPV